MKGLLWVVPTLVWMGCAQREEATPPASDGAAGMPIAVTTHTDAGAPIVAVASASGAREASARITAAERTVLVGHVENARDLGGIALPSGMRVADALLFRGPPLAELTEAGCAAVSELGLRTVIDLRVDSEVSLRPDDSCALAGAQLWAAPLPIPYNVSALDYIEVLDTNESIAAVFERLGDTAHFPVYFHCTWGRDRTGILAAVVLLALGATPEAIMEDYLLSSETVGAYPASLQAALDEIMRRGGIDAYLAAAGVSETQLAAFRSYAIRQTP